MSTGTVQTPLEVLMNELTPKCSGVIWVPREKKDLKGLREDPKEGHEGGEGSGERPQVERGLGMSSWSRGR